ncbi:MAG: VOC family protein [Porticoccaceae bacterium]
MSEYPLMSGKIFQSAFVVENLEKSLDDFSRDLNIGAWLVVGGHKPWPVTYRGAQTGLNIKVALGFSGGMMYELIQQCDEAPSVYRGDDGKLAKGFHHWAVAADDIDSAIRFYEERGYEAVMSIAGRQGLAVYFDARPQLPGIIELIQITPEFQSFVDGIYGLQRPLSQDGPYIQRL